MKQPRRPLSTATVQHSWRATARMLRKRTAFKLRSAGVGVAWGRLRLLWRQRAVIEDVFAPVRRAQASIVNSWLTQVHLHVNASRTNLHHTSRGDLSVSPGIPGRPSAAPVIAIRSSAAKVIFNQSSHPHARPVAAGLHWSVTRTTLVANGHHAARRRVVGEAGAKPNTAPSVTVLRTIRQSRLSVHHMVASKSHAAAIRAVPLPGSVGATRGVPAGTAAASLWPQHTPDLVWRKTPDSASTVVQHENAAHSHSGPASASDSVSAASREPAAAIPSAAAIAAQLRAAPVDAVLADRLALEVIRRVERSMRIERERRGL